MHAKGITVVEVGCKRAGEMEEKSILSQIILLASNIQIHEIFDVMPNRPECSTIVTFVLVASTSECQQLACSHS